MLDFRLKIFQQLSRQTGSLIGIVSNRAVRDGNFQQHSQAFLTNGFFSGYEQAQALKKPALPRHDNQSLAN
jgi:hypothetical protein